jgi:hypothetical protein
MAMRIMYKKFLSVGNGSIVEGVAKQYHFRAKKRAINASNPKRGSE